MASSPILLPLHHNPCALYHHKEGLETCLTLSLPSHASHCHTLSCNAAAAALAGSLLSPSREVSTACALLAATIIHALRAGAPLPSELDERLRLQIEELQDTALGVGEGSGTSPGEGRGGGLRQHIFEFELAAMPCDVMQGKGANWL